jgi:zinc protease
MNAEVNRSEKPSELKKIEFKLPAVSNFELNNSLQVYFVQKSTLPVVNITLVSDAGSRFDPEGKKGLSNLLSMVIDEGAGEYDSLQLSDQFEVLGANFNVGCDQDSIYFSLQILKDEFEKGIELFTTIIADPHLDEEDFNREKRKITTRILQSIDDADEIANEVFEYKVFGDKNSYAYPTIGYEHDINNISIKDIKEYYHNIINPSGAFLIVVGDFEEEKLKNVLNKHFIKWENASPQIPLVSFDTAFSQGLYIVDRKGSVQSEIRTGLISYKRNEYDYFSRSILNLILGGQFSSRLNLNLRENKGFTYGIYSRFIYLKYSAYFFVSTSVASENTGSALNEIFGEIDRIRKGVTKKELDFAKSSLIRKFPSGFESYRQIALNILGQIVHSLPADYFNTYLDEIKKVKTERVFRAAQDNLDTDRLTTVIVGNKDSILEQLKNVYTGKITVLNGNGKEI